MTPLTLLQQHFQVLTDLFIDCDGKSQLVHTVLELSGIAHTCYGGRVQYQSRTVAPHFWLALEIGSQSFLIDYSLHQWLPNSPAIPCGIFQTKLYPQVWYEGTPTALPILSKPFFQLTQFDPRHEQILAYAPLSPLTPDGPDLEGCSDWEKLQTRSTTEKKCLSRWRKIVPSVRRRNIMTITQESSWSLFHLWRDCLHLKQRLSAHQGRMKLLGQEARGLTEPVAAIAIDPRIIELEAALQAALPLFKDALDSDLFEAWLIGNDDLSAGSDVPF